MEKLKINQTEYPATFYGSIKDFSWNNRESKTINLTMDPQVAKTIFFDGVHWSIISEYEVDGETMREEWDNSDFSLAGDIIDHRDGSISVKMGKPTDLEMAYALLYGEDK